jgi:hypothetical protein
MKHLRRATTVHEDVIDTESGQSQGRRISAGLPDRLSHSPSGCNAHANQQIHVIYMISFDLFEKRQKQGVTIFRNSRDFVGAVTSYRQSGMKLESIPVKAGEQQRCSMTICLIIQRPHSWSWTRSATAFSRPI